MAGQLVKSKNTVMLATTGHSDLIRMLRTHGMIVFLGGINLILIQWVLVRELTALLLGTELVVLGVSVAYFVGLSVGYWASSKIRQSWFVTLGLLTLAMHLALPIWFRLLVAALSSTGAYWAAFIILPVLTVFGVSSFYSILLPRFIDHTEGNLPSLYALELLGSAVGVLALVLLGGMGLTAVYLLYCASLLLMLVALRARPTLILLTGALSFAWMMLFPTLNNLTNAVWYEQLHSLPQGTVTRFSAYSAYQKVDVLEDPAGNRYLYLDGLLHFGTDRWSRLNVIMGSVPAALLSPQNTLVIGAGSMQIERLIAEQGGQVTTVELDPVVVEASTRYFDGVNHMSSLPNRSIVIDDAKHFIANTGQRFDLVVTDVPAAFSIQTATLYSTPFYAQIADHLEPDGVLVVNLTTRFQPESEVSRRIAASLLTVFDEVIIVTSESSRLSFAFAGKDLPFDFLELQAALEANDEAAYTLFHRTSIEAIVANARPISLDSMELVLKISADWIADRFTWR